MQVLSLNAVNNVYNELKKSSSHLLDNLSNCLTCAPENFPANARSFLSLNCTSQIFLSMSTMMLKILVDNDNNDIDARQGQLLETKIINFETHRCHRKRNRIGIFWIKN